MSGQAADGAGRPSVAILMEPGRVSRARSARNTFGDGGHPRVSADGSYADRPSRLGEAWEKVKQAPLVNNMVAFVNSVTGHDQPPEPSPSLKFSKFKTLVDVWQGVWFAMCVKIAMADGSLLFASFISASQA